MATYGHSYRMRWPWTRDSLDDRLATLSRRVDDIESESRKVRREWNDTEERLARLGGRIAKRAQRELAQLVDSTPEPDTGHRQEVPEMDEVAKRRAGRAFPGGGR